MYDPTLLESISADEVLHNPILFMRIYSQMFYFPSAKIYDLIKNTMNRSISLQHDAVFHTLYQKSMLLVLSFHRSALFR